MIVKIINKLRINLKLKKCKYVHIMFNDKFNAPYVDFINDYFDSNEHFFICKRFFKEFPFPQGKNVIEVNELKNINLGRNNITKIFFHSLFDSECIELLFNHKELLLKSYWIMWGGDLYSNIKNDQELYVKSNFKGYLAVTKGDIEIVKNKFNIKNLNAEFHAVIYTTPISYKLITEFSKDKIICSSKPNIYIQINNSADESTINLIKILHKKELKNILIRTILSYGADIKIINKVKDFGISLYGNNFEYLEDMLSPEDFIRYFSKNDILILNQNRQQGLGNVFLALAIGIKVFIRSDVSSYKDLQEKGFKIHDTLDINKMTESEFLNFDSNEIISNKNLALNLLNYEITYQKIWGYFFS